MMPAGTQYALFEKVDAQPQFRRARDGDTAGNRPLPFDIVFADNKAKLAELQLADWGARPVELSDSRPQQANQAFDILKKNSSAMVAAHKLAVAMKTWRSEHLGASSAYMGSSSEYWLASSEPSGAAENVPALI